VFMIHGPFGGLFGFIFPFLFIFLGVRLLRQLFRGTSYRRFDQRDRLRLPYDVAPHSVYEPKIAPDTSFETSMFRLADKMRGRLTVSDIVIGTNLGLKEAERRIEEMVDGVHVTMEVTNSGRMVYEFPEIIAKYEASDDVEGAT